MKNTYAFIALSFCSLLAGCGYARAEWHVGDPVVLRPDSVAEPLIADSVAASLGNAPAWDIAENHGMPSPKSDMWWNAFEDPTLRELIARGIDANYNLLAAAKRIEASKAVLRQSQSGYWPSISASASYSRERSAGASLGATTPASEFNAFSLGLSMNWEIDLFGRIAAQARANRADIKAKAADYDAVMVSIASQIASNYISLRTYQSQLEVATRHLESQNEILRITETRFECGLVSKLDVVQARMVVNSTLSSLPALHSLIDSAINALALLTSSTPEDLAFLRTPAPLPEIPAIVPSDLNVSLLRRRPDVVEAEMQLEAVAAQVGIAKKDFLPVLSLTGSIATEGRRADDLFGSRSLAYDISPSLSWTIFDGLSRNYRMAEAKYALEAQTEEYNLTLHTAFQEAANALSSFNASRLEAELDKKVASDSEEAVELSVDRYSQGLSDFSNVVQAQLSYLEYQNSSIQAQGKALSSLVALYTALGGGW